MRGRMGWWLVLAGLVLAVGAQAQLIVDPAGRVEVSQFEFGGALLLSQVAYENSNMNDPEVRRIIVGGYGAYGLHEMVDLYGTLGFIVRAEPEDWDGTGNGFLANFGGRAKFLDLDPLSIHGYAQFGYLSESYGSSNVQGLGASADGEADFMELALGGLARYAFSDTLSCYGGVELVPWSDGTATASAAGWSQDFDMERDGIFSLRGGARFGMEGWWLRADVSIGSEMALLGGAGISF